MNGQGKAQSRGCADLRRKGQILGIRPLQGPNQNEAVTLGRLDYRLTPWGVASAC